MKSRGFTLVELLAVLVLISVIAIIAVPSIINYINQSEGEIDEATKKIVFSGTQLYVDQNKKDFQAPLKQYCVTLQEIVDQKYLSDSIFDSVSGSKIDSNTFVKVINYYNVDKERYDFKYDISNECTEQEYVCVPATEKTVTVGNVPEGNYEAGDEYICQVSNDERYHFFLLKKQGNDTVKLLMDENLGSTVAWYGAARDNSKGPLTVTTALADRTSEWTRLSQSQITIPETQDVADAISDTEWTPGNITKKEGPSWLYTNTSSSRPYGYWTTSKDTRNTTNAWVMFFGKFLGDDNVDNVISYGVRPVITINISEIVD